MTQDQILLLLLNQAWQIALLWLMVTFAFHRFAKSRPHLGHVFCILLLIKFLIPPIWSSPVSVFSWLASAVEQTSISSLWDNSASDTSVAASPSSSNNAQSGLVNSGWSTSVLNIPLSLKVSESTSTQSMSAIWKMGRFGSVDLIPLLFWSWLVSVMIASLWQWGRYFIFLRWINSLCIEESERVQGILTELVDRLEIRRKIRVKILTDSVGPAIVGLFAPTILLPKVIVEKLSDAELRALIAHELIHVRRGDLVWALLQMIVNCLWWFHPVAGWLNQRISDVSELCCDQETISSLRCDASTYARCLISVLEQKHQLHVAPALPGVRPMQVTVERLERIMRLKQGSCQRNPIWIWGLLFVLGMVMIPGAQFGLGQQTNDGTEKTTASTDDGSKAETHTYSVKDLLDRVVTDGLAQKTDADDVLLNILQEYTAEPSDTKVELLPLIMAQPAPVDAKPLPAQALAKPNGEYKLEKGELTVTAPSSVIKTVEDRIAKYREHGFKLIAINFQLFECPSSVVVEATKLSATNEMAVAKLSETQVTALVDRAKDGSEVSRLMAPSLMVCNGQHAQCSTSSQLAVEGAGESDVVKTVETGVWLDATPVLQEKDKVQLHFATKVVTPNSSASTPVATNTVQLETGVEMQLGESMVVAHKPKDASKANKDKWLLVVVKCYDPKTERPAPASK